MGKKIAVVAGEGSELPEQKQVLSPTANELAMRCSTAMYILLTTPHHHQVVQRPPQATKLAMQLQQDKRQEETEIVVVGHRTVGE